MARNSSKRNAVAAQSPVQDTKRRKAGTSDPDDAEKASTEWETLTMNPPPMPKSKSLVAQHSKADLDKRGIAKSSKNKKKKKIDKGQAKTADEQTPDSDEETDFKLNWKPVPIPTYIAGPDEELGGMIGLEELEDVDCVWEEDKETGSRVMTLCKTKKKKAAKRKKRPMAHSAADNSDDEFYGSVDWDEFVLVDDYSEEKAENGELVSIGTLIRENQHEGGENEESDADDTEHIEVDDENKILLEQQLEQQDGDDDVRDPDVDVARWEELGLHSTLLRALKHLGFSQPTDIQSKSLPHSLTGRDIIGAAETGSGKTLAFGVPMLQYIAQHKGEEWKGPAGLVLAPTRELALQVRNHLIAMSKFVGARIVAIVGGMSQAKQERLLGNKPDIIIATPGRFWELVSTNSTYQSQIMEIKFLAIDEADRMLEPGHFRELRFFFKLLNKTELVQKEQCRRQTFVFSATLLKDLQVIARRKPLQKKSKKGPQPPEPGSMEDLIERVNFQDKQPVFVDVTQAEATARTLTEARIDCLANEKDYYLYYFLVRYPGRTLVFVNSIDSIRRMLPILRLLKVNVFGLHAQMEQRQRLKNVDRFRDTENAVLVASDVAARGLDIPRVEYVIHYQIPRSGDLYVHRSGRTARASNEGLAIMLVSPEERKLYYKMCEKLDKDISLFPVDLDLIGRLKPRVDIARDVDLREHKINKRTHEKNWFKKNAKELDIELDSDFMPSDDDDGEDSSIIHSEKIEKQQIKALKGRLSQMLSKKILGRGISGRYLSSSTVNDLAARLMDTDNSNMVIPTLAKESALDAVRTKTSS
ncbi:ATP-dependent RNA helicase [Coemansia sp. RSA 1813]|nr:ATP-dependent RNA helicase [Coemansia sp. RSA 1646]KAJ1772924.1 ATP-dependent RNA helicase [Coemansia sp. RSA 1843]KAJ2093499.1 ATP-dependent RNA helicase [Coemansia sp. RSA 986]KAJ2214316.1 ATP-dependent RNA helicase [Coemansia sp. RSA 487]KAJ2568882.1 ATP-dependent RNA helicase [Coemansia sp. RSA 1813]